MLKIEINTAVAEARLKRMPDAVRQALQEKETDLAGMLVAKARGAAPKKTGTLAAGIRQRVRSSKKWVVARVYVGGKGRKYAHAQEYGAKTKAHEIVAGKAKALAFVAGGKATFAASVQHPGATIPAHPFMRPSLRSMASQIRAGLTAAVRFGLNKGREFQ